MTPAQVKSITDECQRVLTALDAPRENKDTLEAELLHQAAERSKYYLIAFVLVSCMEVECTSRGDVAGWWIDRKRLVDRDAGKLASDFIAKIQA